MTQLIGGGKPHPRQEHKNDSVFLSDVSTLQKCSTILQILYGSANSHPKLKHQKSYPRVTSHVFIIQAQLLRTELFLYFLM